MPTYQHLFDTAKTPIEAVPQGNLNDTEFETRVETWRNYLADAVDGPKFTVQETNLGLIIEGTSVSSGEEFRFSIQFTRNIDTEYGVAKDCELERVLFDPKSSGEYIRCQYSIGTLPSSRQSDEFASAAGTKNWVKIIYDCSTNSQKNIVLGHDRFEMSGKVSPKMIPILEK